MFVVLVATEGGRRNLEVVEVDQAKNIVLLKGAIPGGKNGLVLIESAS